MNEERVQTEDQAILAALEMQPQSRAAVAGDEAVETLVRLYTETIGMLPHGLEPVAPPASLKGRLLMAAAGDETQEVKSPFAQRATSAAARPPAPVWDGATKPGVSVAGTPAPPVPMSPGPAAVPAPRRPTGPVAAAARPSRWPLRLAATLAVAALGLSGWLGWRVEEQNGELARLRTEARQAHERDTELAHLREAMKDMEGNMALASSPSVLVCPLRPALGTTAAPLGSRAVLYVAADHQHWYFTARGLKESPPSQEYQIWFVANGRPVSGGTFSLRPGEAAHVSSATMPAGTTAISITLERKGGSVLPTGPQVLLGDQMQQIS